MTKKLNFSGRTDWKAAYINELRYLKNHFQDIDTNIPFSDTGNLTTITNKMAELHAESKIPFL